MATTMPKQTLLLAIFQGLRQFHPYYEEQPNKIWLGRPTSNHMKLSNSLAGVVYCVASEHTLKDYALRVNDITVAEGRLEIMLWTITNAPKSLAEAIHIALAHEKRRM